MTHHTPITVKGYPTIPARYGITECPVCEGQGSHWNGHGCGGNDPDSWDVPCSNCDGHGNFPCAVCGFDIEVPGYDCLACEMAGAVPLDRLNAETAAALTHSINAAFVALIEANPLEARRAISHAPIQPVAMPVDVTSLPEAQLARQHLAQREAGL